MIDDELLTADEKGITVGKNLEVDGKMQLNGGLKPMHTFTWSITEDGYKWNYTIESLYETIEGTRGYTIFNGYLRIFVSGVDISQDYAIIGEYDAYNGKINQLNGMVFGGYPAMSIVEGTNLQLFSYDSRTNKATFTNYALANKTQPKLFRHMIQLSGGSSADTTCQLEWISPNNLQCDSLEGLRTLLNNPQMDSYVASNPSGDLFSVVISTSTAQLKKVGTTQLVDVTSVSDTVTKL